MRTAETVRAIRLAFIGEVLCACATSYFSILIESKMAEKSFSETSGPSCGPDILIINRNVPRGTSLSVGLHPLRNGLPAGGRGKNGLFKCPADTPPMPGKHCDSVKGSTSHGHGVMPKPTGPVPPPKTK